MSQEIEIEYKVLLTKEEYKRLLASLPFDTSVYEQTNHYFETSPLSLKDKGCALRIREKNNVYQLTLKEPHPDGLLETHNQLTKKEACSWFNNNIDKDKHPIKRLINKGINVDELMYYGTLKTERRQFKESGIIYVLDYSTYNGHVDWELEMEAPSKEIGRNAFHKLLKKFSITHKHTPNKIARFFQTHHSSE